VWGAGGGSGPGGGGVGEAGPAAVAAASRRRWLACPPEVTKRKQRGVAPKFVAAGPQVGLGRYYSPCRRMPLHSRNEGSKSFGRRGRLLLPINTWVFKCVR